MTTLRKLAAILAADAAGYSRLRADDEATTLRSLNTGASAGCLSLQLSIQSAARENALARIAIPRKPIRRG
jgi:hypothetical protein